MMIGVAPSDGQDANSILVRLEKAGPRLDRRHAAFKCLDESKAILAGAHGHQMILITQLTSIVGCKLLCAPSPPALALVMVIPVVAV